MHDSCVVLLGLAVMDVDGEGVPGMAPELFVVGAAPLLRADEQVFEAMIQGWSDQQLSRGLRTDTINGRVLLLRRFQWFTAEGPWSWRPVDLDEFTAELRGERKALPTIRASQGSLRRFLDYMIDPIRVVGGLRGVVRDVSGADLL